MIIYQQLRLDYSIMTLNCEHRSTPHPSVTQLRELFLGDRVRDSSVWLKYLDLILSTRLILFLWFILYTSYLNPEKTYMWSRRQT